MVKELQVSDRNKFKLDRDGLQVRISRNHEDGGRLSDFGHIGIDRAAGSYFGPTHANEVFSIEEVAQMRDALQAILDDAKESQPAVSELLARLPLGAVVVVTDITNHRVTLERRNDGTWFIKTTDKEYNADLRVNAHGVYPDVSRWFDDRDDYTFRHIGNMKLVTELDFEPV